MMVYGYIRVSTDKQTVENQRFEINNFALRENMIIDRWIEETISGTKEVDKRKLGKLLKKLNKGDILICSELSRLGRSLMMIMSILHHCMKNEIEVWTIKDNFRLGKDIQSQVLAFAFGLSAQIERDLISLRTKEGLARRRAEGVVLGRPKGSRSKATKLSGMEAKVKGYLDAGLSYSAIGRLMKVHRLTVSKFVSERIEGRIDVESLNEIEMDPITSKQLSTLINNKDVVLHLIKKKKSNSAISKLYNVEPFIVQIFKNQYKDESSDGKNILEFKANMEKRSKMKQELKKLENEKDTVEMLIANGVNKANIAVMYNVSNDAITQFQK